MIPPYEGTYHVMPFLQIALFGKLPFLRCLFACCVYASMCTAFLRVGSLRDAFERDDFLCVIPI